MIMKIDFKDKNSCENCGAVREKKERNIDDDKPVKCKTCDVEIKYKDLKQHKKSIEHNDVKNLLEKVVSMSKNETEKKNLKIVLGLQ